MTKSCAGRISAHCLHPHTTHHTQRTCSVWFTGLRDGVEFLGCTAEVHGEGTRLSKGVWNIMCADECVAVRATRYIHTRRTASSIQPLLPHSTHALVPRGPMWQLNRSMPAAPDRCLCKVRHNSCTRVSPRGAAAAAAQTVTTWYHAAQSMDKGDITCHTTSPPCICSW